MAIPVEYGGHGRSAVERFVVLEELLVVGAPVQHHWTADRQIAPSLLAFGTEEQKRWFLPRIARGELSFALGLSEPDAGSDLASVKTTARRVEDGWVLNGSKIWTSGAREADYIVVLCRTEPRGEDRHRGLSQLIVPLGSSGVTIRPIVTLDGAARFNEVVFQDAHVAGDHVLGNPGEGWKQITAELGHERAGPDRILSSFQLLNELIRHLALGRGLDALDEHVVGQLLARLWGIRQMSLAVAHAIDTGSAIGAIAAMVKDLGTSLEQATVEAIARLAPRDLSPQVAELLDLAVLTAPTYTLRGGTTEILRTVTARALEGVPR